MSTQNRTTPRGTRRVKTEPPIATPSPMNPEERAQAVAQLHQDLTQVWHALQQLATPGNQGRALLPVIEEGDATLEYRVVLTLSTGDVITMSNVHTFHGLLDEALITDAPEIVSGYMEGQVVRPLLARLQNRISSFLQRIAAARPAMPAPVARQLPPPSVIHEAESPPNTPTHQPEPPAEG